MSNTDRKVQHRANVEKLMAAQSTREGRNRVLLEQTVRSIRAIKKRVLVELDAEIEAELQFMSDNIGDMVAGVEHGVK